MIIAHDTVYIKQHRFDTLVATVQNSIVLNLWG